MNRASTCLLREMRTEVKEMEAASYFENIDRLDRKTSVVLCKLEFRDSKWE